MFPEIKSEIDNTRKILIDLKRKSIELNDVRFAFFDNLFQVYTNLYRVLSYSESELFTEDSKQIYFAFKTEEINNPIQNFKAGFHFGMIVECWSNFEFYITQFCKVVLQKETIEKLLLTKKYLERVSINLKTDQLYELLKNKNFELHQINKDKEFLLFFGKLRNSIHSNYVYYGDDFEYTHNETTYIFRENKPFKQKPLSDLSLFHLSIELRNIFQRLIDNIECKGLIIDPNYAD